MTMDCRDFLLEIGTEEIPARMVARAAADLEVLLVASLDAAGLSHGPSEALFTPRRIAVVVKDVPASQADREEIAYGPSVAMAKTADGSWSPAAAGFARGKGRQADDLVEVDGPKGRVVALKVAVHGRRTLEVLAETVPGLLAQLKFPKSMRWADGRGPFVRPIHWICCLFGDEVVDFRFIGIQSGRESTGHRFMAGDAFTVASPAGYVDQLRERHVIVRASERVSMIREQMDRVETETGLKFIRNDDLFDEISNIVELPILITCEFDRDFLRLPVEVLTTAMAAHQRYFAMQDADGRLSCTFGVVCNNRARDMAVVARGNQRVLAARLYDCRFFWEHDLATGLEKMGERLDGRLFLKDAGTMHDKMRRIVRISEDIAKAAGFDREVRKDLVRAAELCKNDLMSSVVCELPEVQGIMGSYYAAAAGESPAVVNAVRDHYQPRFAGDRLPGADVAAALALADRVDSIATCFHVGAIPTGSRDPLALRRQAIAALRIMISNASLSRLTIPQLLDMAADARGLMDGAKSFMAGAVARVSGKGKDAATVEEFLSERFRGILTDEYGVGQDVANAVLPFLCGESAASPADLVSRATAIRDALADESFRQFLDNVFKRVGNLVRKADEEIPDWRDEVGPAKAMEKIGAFLAQKKTHRNLLDLDEDYTDTFESPLEKDLELCRIAGAVQCANARERHDYTGVLKVMASFEGPLARFIGSGKDGVPVLLEKDEQKKFARLALLDRVFSQFNWFADFSRISTR